MLSGPNGYPANGRPYRFYAPGRPEPSREDQHMMNGSMQSQAALFSQQPGGGAMQHGDGSQGQGSRLGVPVGGQGIGGSSVDGQSNSASGMPGQGAEMNLATVLHYLQSEWRRWERDRNEWDIERAEMRARIALLEGQRRSAENLKVDLMRRTKMLEHALRQERTKSMSQMGKAGAIAPAKIAALQDEDKSSNRDEKEGTPSEGSDEGSSERSRPNGTLPHGLMMSKQIAMSSQSNDNNPWKNAAISRDPKARARSREYLKQCLQEITYLTSPGALNPLPDRPPSSVDPLPNPNDPPPEIRPPEDANDLKPGQNSLNPFPRKVLPEDSPAVTSSTQGEPNDSNHIPNGIGFTHGEATVPPPNEESKPGPSAASVAARAISTDRTADPPSSPAVSTRALPDESPSPVDRNGGNEMLTAIYRPDSKAAWREELQAANEQAEKARSSRPPSAQNDEDQLANLTLNMGELKTDASDTTDKEWTCRRILRSHLDTVRSVAFGHSSTAGIQLITGGDDNTVKVWTVDPATVMHRKLSPNDIEPILTLRGHTAPVTAVQVSPERDLIFSASLDSTIRIWKLPSLTHDPYGPYDPSFSVQTLEGHTDGIWQLLHVTDINSGTDRLVSASADRTVKIWKLSGERYILDSTVDLEHLNPTCLYSERNPADAVYVGLSDGLVRMINLASGQLGRPWSTAEGSQVNGIYQASGGTLLTGHEDGKLRLTHTLGGAPHADKATSTSAHTATITSVASLPLRVGEVFTAGDDGNIRLWDVESLISSQDLAGHRIKGGEGVCQVVSHPDIPILASAGADGTVRLWSKA